MTLIVRLLALAVAWRELKRAEQREQTYRVWWGETWRGETSGTANSAGRVEHIVATPDAGFFDQLCTTPGVGVRRAVHKFGPALEELAHEPEWQEAAWQLERKPPPTPTKRDWRRYRLAMIRYSFNKLLTGQPDRPSQRPSVT